MERFKSIIEMEEYQGMIVGKIIIFGETKKIEFTEATIEDALKTINDTILHNYEKKQVPKVVKEGS